MFKIGTDTQRTAVTVPKSTIVTQLERRLANVEKRIAKWQDRVDNHATYEAQLREERAKAGKQYAIELAKLVKTGKALAYAGDDYRGGHVLEIRFPDKADAIALPQEEQEKHQLHWAQHHLREAKQARRQLKGALRLIGLAVDDTLEVLATDVGMNVMGQNFTGDFFLDDDEDED